MQKIFFFYHLEHLFRRYILTETRSLSPSILSYGEVERIPLYRQKLYTKLIRQMNERKADQSHYRP